AVIRASIASRARWWSSRGFVLHDRIRPRSDWLFPIAVVAALWMSDRHGRHNRAPNVEDVPRLRDYLLGVGIDVSRHSHWRQRSAAVPSRGDPVPDRGTPSLRLDDRAGRALTDRAPVDVGFPARNPDLRSRLRRAVLGRAACA